MKAPVRLPALFFLTSSFLLADTDFTIGVNSYRLVTTARTWDNAQVDAVAKGGNLVRIDSAAENTAVFNAISGIVTTTASDGGGSRYAWIGGRETATEGSYAWAPDTATVFWSGGSPGSAQNGLYQNWGRLASPYGGPEPDNYNSQNRVAMAIAGWPNGAPSFYLIGNAGQWNDLANADTLHYVIEWTPWQNWRKTWFTGASLTNDSVSGPTANPDNDGLSNLLEHAFGTNPTVSNSSPASESNGSIISLGAPSVSITGGQTKLIFARRKAFAAENLTYTASFSGNLYNWTNATATPAVLADNGTMQIVSLDFPQISGAPARFARVLVSLP